MTTKIYIFSLVYSYTPEEIKGLQVKLFDKLKKKQPRKGANHFLESKEKLFA